MIRITYCLFLFYELLCIQCLFRVHILNIYVCITITGSISVLVDYLSLRVSSAQHAGLRQ